MRVVKALLRAIWSVAGRPVVFGAGISILFSVGGAVIYGTDFTLGTIILTLAALWSAAFWLDSSLLKKKKPIRPRPRNRNYENTLERFNRQTIKYRLWQASGVVTVLMLLVMSVLFIRHKRDEKELGSLSGILVPGDEMTPHISCLKGDPPSGTIKVFFDGAVAIVSQFPHTIISANGEPRLAINKQSDGSIGINATVVSGDGRIVAEIENNRFIVNQLNYLTMDRRNSNALKVRDQQGKTVLDVTLLNKDALAISSFVIYVKTGDVAELASRAAPGMCFGNGDGEQQGDFDFTRIPGQKMVMNFKPYTGFGEVKISTSPRHGEVK